MTSYMDEPPLASVEQFPYEQAEKATEILIKLINKRGAEIVEKKVVMQSKVIVHEEMNNKNERKQAKKDSE